VRRFVANELRPHASEWEDARWFPDEVFAKLAGVGFLGLKYPAQLGGEGGDYLHDAVFTEELSRCGSGGLAAGIGAHVGIATPPIWKFGTDEQKQRFLVPAIRGERIAALGITEPGAGSDVAGIATKAEPIDGGWLVNGSKTFITNGVRADFVVTAVKTTSEGGHRGLSFLVIERGMDGFEISEKLEKMGWHASDTAELSFADVFVPEENLLDERNGGFYLIMANFQWERLMMALGAVGSMIKVAIIGLVAIGLIATGTDELALAIFATVAFLVIWLYDVLFEVLAAGRTPGKRVMKLRVVSSQGQPIGLRASLVRNLLRFVDGPLSAYVAGPVSILASPNNQRLGDHAAGSLVLRDRRADDPVADSTSWAHRAQSAADVSAVSAEELATVRTFLERRWSLESRARATLAADLTERLQPRVAGAPPDASPEAFLEWLAAVRAAGWS